MINSHRNSRAQFFRRVENKTREIPRFCSDARTGRESLNRVEQTETLIVLDSIEMPTRI